MRQIKVIFTIVGALIGAGFASGQEISTFFYLYGINGLKGLLICCIFLTCIIYKSLKIINKNNIESYAQFISSLFGKNGLIINTIVNSFLLITFFIMIAGFGAFFAQEFRISHYLGSGFLTILCFFALITNVKGLLKITSFITPLLLICILIIGFTNLCHIDFSNSHDKMPDSKGIFWLINSILYCSYNSILLIPLLVAIKKNIKSTKDIFIISLVCGLIIFILSISIFFLLTKINYEIINKQEMPVLYVIHRFYTPFIKIYTFIILSSIYTTAISIGISFLNNLSLERTSYPLIITIMCITGFILSGVGFSNLVSTFYPFFGYLGLIQLFFIFLQKGT